MTLAAPIGRRTKLTPELQAEIVARLVDGDPIESAAEAVGIRDQTLRNWLRWGAERPEGVYGRLVAAIRRAEKALVRRLGRRPRTKGQLNKWFERTLGVRLPAKSVCPGHDAPLDVAWDLFNNEVDEALVLASRSGGKTMLLAMLHVANCYWKPGYTTVHFGSVENQAKRAYQHFQRFLAADALKGQAVDSRVKKTVWRNGSEIEILPGTEKQTQGPHTYLVSWDELESGERQPYENARGIPINDPDGHAGQFVTTSTRQKPGGLMQQALDDAPRRGARIYTYCVWETIQPATVPKNCKHSEAEHLEPGTNGWACTQPLYKYTKGLRLKKADGWRPLSDVLATYRRMAEDTFEAQVLNMRPETGALIYPNFAEANISEDAEYKPGTGLLWGWDAGFNDPTWIGFFQLHGGAFHLFDEVVGRHRSARHWIRQGLEKVLALPDYEGPKLEAWRRYWDNGEQPDKWPEQVWPHATGDPTAGNFYFELGEHGVGRSHPRRVKHQLEDGQDALRAAISAAGKVRLYVHPRCEQFLKAVKNYRAVELPDGSYGERPENTPSNHKYSHPLDGARYLVYRFRRELGLGAGRRGDETD